MLVSISCFVLKLTSVILPLQQLNSKDRNESVSVMYGQAYVRRNRAKAAQVGPKAQ
jgi:hypothetical protein